MGTFAQLLDLGIGLRTDAYSNPVCVADAVT
jgi:hypothetical protein